MKRWPMWLFMAAVVVALLAFGSQRANDSGTAPERVKAIAATIKCPVCSGESIAVSRVPAAVAIREEIARQVAEGRSDSEVRQAINAAYPDATILTPPSSGFASLVWILPVALLIAGGFGLASAFRRWQPA